MEQSIHAQINTLRHSCPDCNVPMLAIYANQTGGEEVCVSCGDAWSYVVQPEVDWS